AATTRAAPPAARAAATAATTGLLRAVEGLVEYAGHIDGAGVFEVDDLEVAFVGVGPRQQEGEFLDELQGLGVFTGDDQLVAERGDRDRRSFLGVLALLPRDKKLLPVLGRLLALAVGDGHQAAAGVVQRGLLLGALLLGLEFLQWRVAQIAGWQDDLHLVRPHLLDVFLECLRERGGAALVQVDDAHAGVGGEIVTSLDGLDGVADLLDLLLGAAAENAVAACVALVVR